ncbi:hypothetical protein BKA62DRAFT_711374 [Auriculariales sp. MPI-PUGE-AT-0066]|nr:hypothetical protein BKA62DRAFT_711374 [Auriculariales sp. MPI-PUGE-AT-0066]
MRAIPPELLALILDKAERTDVVRMGGISRHWRTVAIGHDNFYFPMKLVIRQRERESIGALSLIKRVEASLSSTVPLLISITTSRSVPDHLSKGAEAITLFTAIARCISRAKVLNICSRPVWVNALLSSFCDSPAPSLHTMVVAAMGRDCPTSIDASCALFACAAPKLRTARFRGLRCPRAAIPAFQNVTSLVLRRSSQRELPLALVFPSLHTLILSVIDLGSIAESPYVPPTLSKLAIGCDGSRISINSGIAFLYQKMGHTVSNLKLDAAPYFHGISDQLHLLVQLHSHDGDDNPLDGHVSSLVTFSNACGNFQRTFWQEASQSGVSLAAFAPLFDRLSRIDIIHAHFVHLLVAATVFPTVQVLRLGLYGLRSLIWPCDDWAEVHYAAPKEANVFPRLLELCLPHEMTTDLGIQTRPLLRLMNVQLEDHSRAIVDGRFDQVVVEPIGIVHIQSRFN